MSNDSDPMPVFTIHAKDNLSRATLAYYGLLCTSSGLHDQAVEVSKALNELMAWRERNPDKLKMPDHKHVYVKDA